MRRSPSIARLRRAASSLLANSRGIKRWSDVSVSAPLVFSSTGIPGNAGLSSTNLCPQWMQNLADGGKSFPHCGHFFPSWDPQFKQNFAPSGFSVLQLEQIIKIPIPKP
jgi:hypothetical protein